MQIDMNGETLNNTAKTIASIKKQFENIKSVEGIYVTCTVAGDWNSDISVEVIAVTNKLKIDMNQTNVSDIVAQFCNTVSFKFGVNQISLTDLTDNDEQLSKSIIVYDRLGLLAHRKQYLDSSSRYASIGSSTRNFILEKAR